MEALAVFVLPAILRGPSRIGSAFELGQADGLPSYLYIYHHCACTRGIKRSLYASPAHAPCPILNPADFTFRIVM